MPAVEVLRGFCDLCYNSVTIGQGGQYRMELGLFTCGYQYTNIESAFIDAAAFGYDFIELWGGRPHAWAPDMDAGRVAQLQELSARYAVPIRVRFSRVSGVPMSLL